MFGVPRFTYSEGALRDGVLLDTMSRLSGDRVGPLHHLRDVSRRSIRQLADRCDDDPAHSAHVARLAVELFDALAPIHGLDATAREYLEAGALLANVGLVVAHSKHHLHAYYVIRNSELAGLTDAEIEVIAQIARYHRKSAPKPSHPDFAALPPADQDLVRALAAILRVAIGLDRSHQARVRHVGTELGRATGWSSTSRAPTAPTPASSCTPPTSARSSSRRCSGAASSWSTAARQPPVVDVVVRRPLVVTGTVDVVVDVVVVAAGVGAGVVGGSVGGTVGSAVVSGGGGRRRRGGRRREHGVERRGLGAVLLRLLLPVPHVHRLADLDQALELGRDRVGDPDAAVRGRVRRHLERAVDGDAVVEVHRVEHPPERALAPPLHLPVVARTPRRASARAPAPAGVSGSVPSSLPYSPGLIVTSSHPLLAVAGRDVADEQRPVAVEHDEHLLGQVDLGVLAGVGAAGGDRHRVLHRAATSSA